MCREHIKAIGLIILFSLYGLCCFAQYLPGSLIERRPGYKPKPPRLIVGTDAVRSHLNKIIIDTQCISHWESFDNEKAAISDDGSYYCYSINNRPFGSKTLVVEALNGSWKKQLVGVENGFFSATSREFIYLHNEILYFLQLGTDKLRSVGSVKNFQTPKDKRGEWMSYQLKSNELIIQNLISGVQRQFSSVSSYIYGSDARSMLIRAGFKDGGDGMQKLLWYSLTEDKQYDIEFPTGGYEMSSYSLDDKRGQIAILARDKLSKDRYSVWYYRKEMKKLISIADEDTRVINAGFKIGASAPGFTADGRFIILSLVKESNGISAGNGVQVDVWGYKDLKLQNAQMRDLQRAPTMECPAAIAVELVESSGRRIVPIGLVGGHIYEGFASTEGKYCFTVQSSEGDKFWRTIPNSYRLVSMNDGSVREVASSAKRLDFWFSPGGKYLLQFYEGEYYSYESESGKKMRVSNLNKIGWGWHSPFHRGFGFEKDIPVGVAGWLDETNALVYDNYDIWQLDLKGAKAPINITSYLGQRNNWKMRIIEENKAYKTGDTAIVTILNPENKLNGLFRLVLGDNRILNKPTVEPVAIFYFSDAKHGAAASSASFGTALMAPIKAKNKNVWLVQRQTATSSPNYFVTTDFAQYRRLTNEQPQNRYNWLTADLLDWEMPDGSMGKGILYKPENFDPNKKYPLLIDMYEWKSGLYYQFPLPKMIRATHVNIPLMVSRGYLVFSLDMKYVKNKMVASSCETVTSAAQSLAMLPFIDKKRMAFSGFSWGGTQANWLIAQTNVFAAAATGGAQADPVSTFLQISGPEGKPLFDAMDSKTEVTYGGTIWENPAGWFKASPILRADKITTPLLMMNNFRDRWWHQATELFMAMRRLEKPIWMLQYDAGGHGVYSKEEDARDFTIRYIQFFNHYLKSAPAPSWMTQGVPARLKGFFAGYDYDLSGNCGKDCAVCRKWNQRWKRDSTAIRTAMKDWEKL